MKKIQMTAPAKINLCLEVVKRYDNGFHEIRSIMRKSSELYDTVIVEFSEDHDDIVITCDDPEVPTDESNICWKIAKNYFAVLGKNIGVKIHIEKKIPMCAGLGGGSSDGASVLLAINEYFADALSMNQLIEIAEAVGKDIPFFLQDAHHAYVCGAGERTESLFDFPALPMLIIYPNGEITTPWAYGQLDQRQWFMDFEERVNITDRMKNNVGVPDDIIQSLHNDFTFIAREKYPIINEIEVALKAFGAKGVSISGKGPTVFGIFDSIEEIEKVQNILKKQYPEFFVSKF